MGSIYLNRASNWYLMVDTDTPSIKGSTVWKTTVSAWVKYNNSWQQVWPTGSPPVVPPPAPVDGVVSIVDDTLYSTGFINVATAVCKYSLKSDRAIQTIDDAGTNVPSYWVSSTGVAANYQAMATGLINIGVKDTWIDLNTNPIWGLGRTAEGVSHCVMTVSIRNKATQVILDTASIDLTCSVTNPSGTGGETPPPGDDSGGGPVIVYP